MGKWGGKVKMSTTLAVIRSRVRVKIREVDSKHDTFGVLEIDGAIADAYILLASQIPTPRLLTAGLFTITAGAQTFSFPVGEYEPDVSIQLDSDKTFLRKVDRDELESLRSGTLITSTGKPYVYTLHEDSSQVLQGDVWPPSSIAESCNVYAAATATDIRDAASMDAATIIFGRRGIVSLVGHAAANLVDGMTAEELQKRNINPAITKRWRYEADVLMYAEEMRQNAMGDSGRTQRWVV